MTSKSRTSNFLIARGMTSRDRAILRLAELDLSTHSNASRKAIEALIAKLKAGLEIEGFPTPIEIATSIAAARPRAIPFDEAHRTLGFTHNLSNLDAMSAAFENLSDFGGLKLSALQAAIQAGEFRRQANLAWQRRDPDQSAA